MSMIKVPSPDFSFHKDEGLDIYISAYEHPTQFWIQIIGSHSHQLHQLLIEMNQHYENSLPEDLVVHVDQVPENCGHLPECFIVLTEPHYVTLDGQELNVRPDWA
ncbi:tudor and KH domain-containing protein [Cricetulus griseus]|nr:tudor and KH domain-containing protein [Cricetulus griseus]